MGVGPFPSGKQNKNNQKKKKIVKKKKKVAYFLAETKNI